MKTENQQMERSNKREEQKEEEKYMEFHKCIFEQIELVILFTSCLKSKQKVRIIEHNGKTIYMLFGNR